jgi:hypothetical protein
MTAVGFEWQTVNGVSLANQLILSLANHLRGSNYARWDEEKIETRKQI